MKGHLLGISFQHSLDMFFTSQPCEGPARCEEAKWSNLNRGMARQKCKCIIAILIEEWWELSPVKIGAHHCGISTSHAFSTCWLTPNTVCKYIVELFVVGFFLPLMEVFEISYQTWSLPAFHAQPNFKKLKINPGSLHFYSKSASNIFAKWIPILCGHSLSLASNLLSLSLVNLQQSDYESTL